MEVAFRQERSGAPNRARRGTIFPGTANRADGPTAAAEWFAARRTAVAPPPADDDYLGGRRQGNSSTSPGPRTGGTPVPPTGRRSHRPDRINRIMNQRLEGW